MLWFKFLCNSLNVIFYSWMFWAFCSCWLIRLDHTKDITELVEVGWLEGQLSVQILAEYEKKACSIIKPWIKTSPRVSEVPLPLISGSAGTYWILNSRWICLPLFKRIFNAARYNNSNNVQYQPGWLQCQLMFWYAEIEIKRNWIQLISHWRSMLYAAMSKSMLLWGKIKTISEFLGL